MIPSSFLKYLLIDFMLADVCTWVYTGVPCGNSEECTGSSGAGLADGGKPPCVCWKMNSDLLQEPNVLILIESSLKFKSYLLNVFNILFIF